ncbi:Bax inhibitor-1/YccA family protein [Desulfopila sp. IMCC35008]|uniref:Bax inhibitor-1/YccA family protein n=1 Tax=Desulfopila sp. IMCC35008 TaxID=2653858 RepID=UPI0013D47735|nr:Bax inhibitor-1/YccA family protein [Desulfopila sp. IMCC35008]
MYGQTNQVTLDQARQEASSIFLAKVFNWMAVGLGLTGVVAYLTAATGITYALVQSPLFYVLIFGELGLVIYLSARVQKLQASTATALFVAYAALNGITMSIIFLRYTSTSIAGTFFITAGMFGAMALYGLITKRDLSGFGSFLMMGLVGIIIAMIVNFFLASSVLHMAISAIGVFIFTGLTAFDVQRIKQIGEAGILEQGGDVVKKGAIMGALTLYLDFINLFWMLLQFFGGSND